MKKLVIIITALLFNLVACATITPAIGLPMWPTFAVSTGIMSFLPMPSGVSMAVQKEIWINDIVGNLYRSNPFLQYAVNHDQFVLAGKVVHIPQAGAKPTVVKNRTSLPATVTRRDDTDITYVLDEYTSDPLLIPNADTVELSYDKRQSILGETQSAIAETVGDEMLYKWAPSATAQIIRTTGSAVLSHTTSATGNRKAMTVADVRAAKELLNKQSVAMDGRVLILDSSMYAQLTADLAVTQYRDFSVAYNQKTGTIEMLEGFVIIQRPYVLRYTNATPPVLKTPDAVGASDDNGAGLAWQSLMVARAMGDNNFFERLSDPQYYGDVYSALVRMGGRKMRTNQEGVVAIVQAATT